jgi:hypothetical protein
MVHGVYRYALWDVSNPHLFVVLAPAHEAFCIKLPAYDPFGKKKTKKPKVTVK